MPFDVCVCLCMRALHSKCHRKTYAQGKTIATAWICVDSTNSNKFISHLPIVIWLWVKLSKHPKCLRFSFTKLIAWTATIIALPSPSSSSLTNKNASQYFSFSFTYRTNFIFFDSWNCQTQYLHYCDCNFGVLFASNILICIDVSSQVFLAAQTHTHTYKLWLKT